AQGDDRRIAAHEIDAAALDLWRQTKLLHQLNVKARRKKSGACHRYDVGDLRLNKLKIFELFHSREGKGNGFFLKNIHSLRKPRLRLQGVTGRKKLIPGCAR